MISSFCFRFSCAAWSSESSFFVSLTFPRIRSSCAFCRSLYFSVMTFNSSLALFRSISASERACLIFPISFSRSPIFISISRFCMDRAKFSALKLSRSIMFCLLVYWSSLNFLPGTQVMAEIANSTAMRVTVNGLFMIRRRL